MKKLLLVLLISTSAVAQTEADRRKVCQVIGDLAYQIAKERDIGTSERSLRNEAWGEDSEIMRELMMTLIETIYKRPHKTVDEEAMLAETACLRATFGGKRT